MHPVSQYNVSEVVWQCFWGRRTEKYGQGVVSAHGWVMMRTTLHTDEIQKSNIPTLGFQYRKTTSLLSSTSSRRRTKKSTSHSLLRPQSFRNRVLRLKPLKISAAARPNPILKNPLGLKFF